MTVRFCTNCKTVVGFSHVCPEYKPETTSEFLNVIDEIELSKLYAQYWIAMATTGACQNRDLSHGTSGLAFTPEEKVLEAMEIAHHHIERMRQLIDKKSDLLLEGSNG